MILKRPAMWAVLWALAIMVLTLMPGNDLQGWPWAERVQLDKWVHAFLFGVQCVLLGMAFARTRPSGGRIRPYLLAAVLAIAYGGAIELIQEAMGDGRHGDVLDLFADTVGVLLGYWLLRRRA